LTAGCLGESELAAFAKAGKFDETSVALSLLSALSIGVIERAMAQQDCDHLLIVAKAIGLCWETTKELLLLQVGPGKMPRYELDQNQAKFAKLQARTAKKGIEFYRMRRLAETALG